MEDSTFCSHIRNFDKVVCNGERAVEDFAHVLDGVEFEHVAEFDLSRLLGLVERR